MSLLTLYCLCAADFLLAALNGVYYFKSDEPFWLNAAVMGWCAAFGVDLTIRTITEHLDQHKDEEDPT